jgi:cytochrome c biogenesis factor
MSGLGSLIFRILSGERFRKARPDENRSGAVSLFVIALGFELLLLAQKYRPSAVETVFGGSALDLWIAGTCVISIGVFGSFLMWKYISMKVMVVLAILAWLALLGTLLGFGIFVGNIP